MLILYIFPDSIPMCKEVKWLLKRGVFSFYVLRIWYGDGWNLNVNIPHH